MRSIVTTSSMKLLCSAIVAGALLCGVVAPARAAEPAKGDAKDEWTARYDKARTDMIEGRVREAPRY